MAKMASIKIKFKVVLHYKTFIIKYYHTETQYRCGIIAYSETVRGSRDAAALAVKTI